MSKEKKYQAEVNFREIFANPQRWFGLIYLILIIGLVIGGRYYVQNINTISTNKSQYINLNKDDRQEEVPMQKGMEMEGIDIKEAVVINDEKIASGKELYSQNCSSCHGDEGRGDGIAGASLNPVPRNFHDKTGWTNGYKFSQIYKTLEEGIIKNGMNAYNFLSPSDRINMILYIQSLTDLPKASDDELMELDLTYSLSDGRKTNNTIPISKAIDLVSSEKFNNKKIDNIVSMFTDSQIVGFINNKEYAAYTLLTNISWKSDKELLKKYIYSGLPNNGFNARLMTMSESDWNTLHTELVQIYSEI